MALLNQTYSSINMANHEVNYYCEYKKYLCYMTSHHHNTDYDVQNNHLDPREPLLELF